MNVKKKHFFFCYESDQTVEHVSERGWDVSISGHLQNPTGHNSDQLALSDSALNRGTQPDDLQRSLPDSMI